MNLARIGLTVAVAGTLDIASAMVLTLSKGRSIANMLQGVASGPFGDGAQDWGLPGAFLGLLTHFTIMTVMVVVFAWAITRFRITTSPAILGPAYGLLLYGVMYWVVLPLRWPDTFPSTSVRGMVVPIVIHIFLVGLPIALIASRDALGGHEGGVAEEVIERI